MVHFLRTISNMLLSYPVWIHVDVGYDAFKQKVYEISKSIDVHDVNKNAELNQYFLLIENILCFTHCIFFQERT